MATLPYKGGCAWSRIADPLSSGGQPEEWLEAVFIKKALEPLQRRKRAHSVLLYFA